VAFCFFFHPPLGLYCTPVLQSRKFAFVAIPRYMAFCGFPICYILCQHGVWLLMCLTNAGGKRRSRTRRLRVRGASGSALPQLRPPEPQLRVKQGAGTATKTHITATYSRAHKDARTHARTHGRTHARTHARTPPR
jgi:hypothetical protein